MSTLPPGMDPQYEPWQPQPVAYGPSPRYATAAVWLWVLSGILLLIGLCCIGPTVAVVAIDPGELIKQMPPDQREQFQEIGEAGLVAVMAGVLICFSLLPALLLIGLGFPVRRGHPWAVVVSMVVLGFFGLGLIFMVLGSLLSGDPLSIAVNAAVFGGLALLVLIAEIALIRALMSPAPSAAPPAQAAPFQKDPWHL